MLFCSVSLRVHASLSADWLALKRRAGLNDLEGDVTARREDLTDKLMVRAEQAVALLAAHLEDEGDRLYAGRVRAAEGILGNILRSRRHAEATRKQAIRRRHAIRVKPVQEFHERM